MRKRSLRAGSERAVKCTESCSVSLGRTMLQELKFQLSTAVLTVLTVAAAISAGINFSQQLRFRLPDDGVTWVDRTQPGSSTAVQALHVVADSGAANAGLRT